MGKGFSPGRVLNRDDSKQRLRMSVCKRRPKMFGFSTRRPPNTKEIIHNRDAEDSSNLVGEVAFPSSRAGVEVMCSRAAVVDRDNNKPGVVSLSRVRVQGLPNSSFHKDHRDNHRWRVEEAGNLVVGEESLVVGEESQVVGEEEDGEEEEEEVGEGLVPMHLLQGQSGLHFPICPKLFSPFLLQLLLTNSSRS